MKRFRWAPHVLGLLMVLCPAANGWAHTKPNILVIWGDDIGMWNISAYHRGMMGGRTPNIDRIAQEGALFTDAYAQQSCTAGRAAFITGQHPIRTGLLTFGMPGAKSGLQSTDPTIAELLKDHGYLTGQFGKNHLGDMNEYLPTVHGFDQFYGNLYYLNSEEEPEDPDYPNTPAFHEQFGPRGVLKCKASDVDDPTIDPRWGRVGRQTCQDTGPLTRKRMKTIDDDFLSGTLEFIETAVKASDPFFIWHNSTRTYVGTHLQKKYQNATGFGLYAEAMKELDDQVGRLLKKLEELRIADNTIVIFSTDNGAEVASGPYGGNTPFRGEKGTTWEGGFRVPAMVRWPGVIDPGTVINEIFSHEDWLPTLLAAAGNTEIKDDLNKGYEVGGNRFKVHLDGYNQLDLLSGTGKSARKEIFYFDAGGNLNAVRYNQWKLHFTIMEGDITKAYRKTPTWPIVVNLRQDPFERFPFESQRYLRWMADKMWTFGPAQTIVASFLQTFKDFPPSQEVASLSVEKVLKQLQTQANRQ